MNSEKEKSKIWLILFLLFFIIVVIAAGMLCRQYMDRQTANAQFESLQTSVNDEADVSAENTEEIYIEENEEESGANDTEGESGKTDMESDAENDGKATDIDIKETDILEEYGIEIPEKDLDWDALHEQNEDIYAWIYVPDTTVDYPVLQHPTDNSYYLNYNMDGTKGYPGCIYTEDFNSKDFSDIHTVIYGHNLKDKTMFSSLHNFEDKELLSEDHYIFIYTQDHVFVYRIFAAYEFSAIHLLDNYDYTNEYVYADYLKQIYRTADRVANVREDIEVTTDDKIVTLSTCTEDHDSGRRFLVTGVLLNPEK